MFGFHSRSRSLIPVKDMDFWESEKKSEGKKLAMGHDDEGAQIESREAAEMEVPRTPRQNRNLTMVYLLFLAEAIMAASLASQIATLIPDASGCAGVGSSFLQSVLEGAYFAGSTAGVAWGCVCDRVGRRKVALAGLGGMAVCCLLMGVADDLPAMAILRFVSGATASAVMVSALAMLADLTHGSSDQTRLVARLPVIAVCGNIGPLASHAIQRLGAGNLYRVFGDHPNMAAQLACAGMVLTIAVAEVLLLEETLPDFGQQVATEEDYDCEKTAFLDHTLSDDSFQSLNISIIEALNDDAARPLPSHISVLQVLTAPSILIMLASFSLLSLHSSTFDVLLPHLGHSETHSGGLGIPCGLLGPLLLVVKALAALRILHLVPSVVARVGVLSMYRRISVVFPALYIMIPLITLGTYATGIDATAFSAVFNTFTIFAKTTLAGAAQVLVLLLVLSSSPDASATGTFVGVTSISGMFKALAAGASGLSYYVSGDYAMVTINGISWAVVVATALIGMFVTWKLREAPRVGADIPSECLAWHGVFDAGSDEEPGF